MTISSLAQSFSRESQTTLRNSTQFTSVKETMQELQQQMATGKVNDDWTKLGTDRLKSLDINARLSALDGYASNIGDGQLRLKIMDQAIAQLDKSRSSATGELALDSWSLRAGGTTQGQIMITGKFNEMVDLLNQDVAGRYVFSGRSTDVRPVASADAILNGAGGKIGLKQAIIDQKTADLGSGLGGLAVGTAGSTVTVTKPTTGGLTVSGTSSFNFSPQPVEGDTFTLTLTLPDGSTEARTLRATTNPGSATDTFVIGGSPAATAANFATSLTAALTQTAATSLPAASAVKASQDFFAGTVPNSVDWYVGDSSASPRDTALVRASDGQPIATGAQADEAPFRNLLASYAVMAAESFSVTDPNSPGRYDAVKARLTTAFGESPGTRIKDVQGELALASADLATAKERNTATKAVLTDRVGDIENTKLEDVVAQLLSLQTQLQASYQTASMVSRLSLVNYLG